jgi:hypothetical protein
MFTSYIGKKLLKLYNQKNQTDLTARGFFDEILFPLFFNDERHLMHVSNSPFFQKPNANATKTGITKSQAQLQKLHADIESEIPNMAIFVGYAAKDLGGTTSGQLTNIDFEIDSEEMYASWIGEGLAIGVSGGFIMLIEEEDIIWELFQGWQHYRTYLSQTEHLKDKQIETWNGHWICHTFSKGFDPMNVWIGFDPKPAEQLGKFAIPTQDWIKVIFALARQYPKQVLTAYAYNLSQTNTTLGFINIYLPEVRRLIDLQTHIIPPVETDAITDGQLEGIYATYHNFKNACKLGAIGLKAIEPGKLREYMPKPFGLGKDYQFKDIESYQYFQLYKTWIIAMISNKTELDRLANQLAHALILFEQASDSDNRGKSTRTRHTEAIRNATNLRFFLDQLAKLMEEDGSTSEILYTTKDAILKMPADLFPLFITLVRFEYTYLKQKNN